jgi:hypothetical protein
MKTFALMLIVSTIAATTAIAETNNPERKIEVSDSKIIAWSGRSIPLYPVELQSVNPATLNKIAATGESEEVIITEGSVRFLFLPPARSTINKLDATVSFDPETTSFSIDQYKRIDISKVNTWLWWLMPFFIFMAAFGSIKESVSHLYLSGKILTPSLACLFIIITPALLSYGIPELHRIQAIFCIFYAIFISILTRTIFYNAMIAIMLFSFNYNIATNLNDAHNNFFEFEIIVAAITWALVNWDLILRRKKKEEGKITLSVNSSHKR